MSGEPQTPQDQDLDACRCCEGADAGPASVVNRPGLPALRYRIGTWASFLERMLARIPLQAIPDGSDEGTRPLQALTSRAPDDPAIALLDAWATAADVLSFYQERIANEGFLGTAIERRSVLELARAIGYELAPGVAASTWLAFTVEQPVLPAGAAVPPEQRALQGLPGGSAPGTARVPQGTPVKSIPGPDESPQTFETSEELGARVEWNDLRPQLTQPQALDPDAPTVWVQGVQAPLKPGSRVLFVTRDAGGALHSDVRRVVSLVVEDAHQRTRVELENPPAPPPARVVPDRYGVSYAHPSAAPMAFDSGAIDSVMNVAGQAWMETDLSAHLGMQPRWQAGALSIYAFGVLSSTAPPPPVGFDPDTVQTGLFALTVRTAAFGHNAPRYDTLPEEQRGSGNAYPVDWDDTVLAPSIAKDSQGDFYTLADLFLERSVDEVQKAGWLVLEGASTPRALRVAEVVQSSLADFALSGRATGVRVQDPDAPGAVVDLGSFARRRTTIHAGSVGLALAQLPIPDAVGRGTVEEAQITLDRLVLGLTPGRAVAVSGERADLPGVIESEVARIDAVIHESLRTTLFFQSALRNVYLRATVSLNANVVAATHGESVSEVLGSGDATAANQRFLLKKAPLTYVAADTPAGAASTLEVRVNGLKWQPQAALYGLDPAQPAYTVRIDDDARATVLFGDGRQGARLPTGTANVIASYRSGIGLQGEVAAGALTLLQGRPLGIRGVVNPVAASGAQDPERLADAREHAPLTVRTLERVVSLQDHADFARAFAGVGKAQADVLWTGRARQVAVTIAAASGEPVAEGDALFQKLNDALQAVRAAFEPFQVVSFRRLFFDIRATLRVDPAHDAAAVLAAARAALLDAFAFARRGFGQPVAAAEVIAVIHGVSGVVAADLDALCLVTEDPASAATLASVLPARPARWEDGAVAPAELLLVNPAGVTLAEMSA